MDFGTVRLQSRGKEDSSTSAVRKAAESDIAIVGIGMQLPLAENESELLQLLREGTDAVRTLPESRRADTDRYFRAAGTDPASLRYGEAAFLEMIDRFDYTFFKLSPKEASLLDPNQRLFLETAWRAIEDAGMGGRRLIGSRTGVYVGYGSDSEYKRMIDQAEPEAASMAMPGNVKPIIASRLSYLLDLRGPSLLVDTTCSSSLVAVHLACQAIRNGECDQAIAGGIQLHLLPVRDFEVGIESSTARTRTFDDEADGTGTGEGAVAIVLKPLARALLDRDPVYAVIKGSAVNQDGSSVGITAPNADAQADVIAEAWRQAGISPDTIGYIETHGTGTKLGDPIELEGIRRAFARYTNRKMFCAVGSIKSNFGHLDNAAGIAGLLKTVLSLKHRQLFPTLHVERPNRAISFVDSPAYINTHLEVWEEGNNPLRCGVSSFGISGTNCHVVLEQAPAPQPDSAVAEPSLFVSSGRLELLPLSARSEASLIELAARYADYLDTNSDVSLFDICHTASTSRGHYPYRLAVLARDRKEMSASLRRVNPVHIHGPVTSDGETNRLAAVALERLRQETYSDSVRELSRLYEAGADIRWERLYEERNAARVNLPATPFERQRCWIRLPEDDAPKAAIPMYHRLEWREEPLPITADRTTARACRLPDIIAGTNRGLIARAAARLRALARQSDALEPGLTEMVLSAVPTGLAVSTEATIEAWEAEFHQLFQQSDGADGRTMVLLLNGEEADAIESLNSEACRLLGLLRALKAEKYNKPVRLILAAAGVYRVIGNEESSNRNAAALFAMGKAIQWEMPHIQVRTVDYGCWADDVDGLAAAITREQDNAVPYSTAWRSGKRYVERMCELHNFSEDEAPYTWRSEGVYLVTGGLGGIGLRIAQQIAAKGDVTIALLNRSPFPPREAWDHIVSVQSESSDAQRIRNIRSIEQNGARVDIISADVADESSLQEALQLLRRRYRRVNGIVHAAGSGAGNYLTALTEKDFHTFTAAKVQGTRLLDELTLPDDLDFLVLFSSAITLVGGVGSGPYTAANAWLDAYATARRAEGGRVLSIGWPAWERTGLSATSEPDERKELFRILRPEDGMEAFERLLRADAPHIIVGEWNRESALFELGDRLPFRSDVAAAASGKLLETRSANTKRTAPVKLKGKTEGASYTDVEQKVAQAWMAVLGYEELGVNDNFFELGGDSILIARLHAKLQDEFPGRTKIADLFSHPTIAKISLFLQPEDNRSVDDSTMGTEDSRPNYNADEATDIAIIGMTVRMPDAPDLDSFWANLIGGKQSIRAYPDERQADGRRFIAHFTDVPDEEIRFSHGGYLDHVDQFDSEFFGISPREASLMDPNQRMFLEASWEAIEDAGYGGGKIRSTRTGVYLGYADWPVYGQYITKKFPSLIHAAGAGNTPSLIASRIAYMLDLQGPAFLVDTACSSSLVAIHLACQAIRSGECDMALAGGVKACLMPVDGVFEIGIESSHRQTRAFDDDSDGTVWGEGTVALLLKPVEQALADGDRVYAVIKGSAINQDGASAGITAPNAVAQEKVIVQAWKNTAIDPATVTYIETHGTGTKLGDPIEVDGIQRAFERYTGKKQFCAIGSVKSNIGHLDSAAGAAGLAKAVASLLHKQLAPTLHFERPNRNIAFERSPVYVVDRPQEWDTDGTPRRCGVSSFGFSGTNCHIVLEEAPLHCSRTEAIEEEREQWRILALSGKSEEALRSLMRSYRGFLRSSSDALEDICATANTGRGHYAYRAALVFRNRSELQQQLEQGESGASSDSDLGKRSVYQGFHRVITGEREGAEPGMLTVSEHRKLSAQTNALLEQLFTRPNSDMIDEESVMNELAQLYVSGAEVGWEQMYEGGQTRKVRVPTYPFQRQRHWIGPEPEVLTTEARTRPSRERAAERAMAKVTVKGLRTNGAGSLEDRLGQLWGSLLGITELGVDDDFFELGGHSLLAIELERELARRSVEIDADDLYQHRTINALSRYIRQSGGEMNAIDTMNAIPAGERVSRSLPATSSLSARETVSRTVEPLMDEHSGSAPLPETLILPGIEPFNDIFYRNCFYNSMFPVIRSFGRSIVPFLANDLVVYEEADGEYAATYSAVQTMEAIFAQSGVRAETRYGSDDIVRELLDGLAGGQPAVVWVDCHELPIRQDAYGKRHIDHTLLIFGFDRRERLFHIVEHDRMENLSYRRRTLPFDDLTRAFDSFMDRYVRTGQHEATHYYFAPAPLPTGSASDPAVQWARTWHEGRHTLADSAAVLDRFIADYCRITADEESLRTHVDRLVAFLNDAATAKRVEIYRLDALLPEAEEERAVLSGILADWEYVRKGMARYMYGDAYRQAAFEVGAERLRRIAEQERMLQQMIVAKLDTSAERTLK
ncbi:SDR family NAD(P)-dependent oxidoreductase [Paenibacillus kobensis]|uniref:SDR family NAD(P)-dependent oxidoreductase n=1 Tax=Paenibacillus kobensis TaxID=59841 RepID=UPI000FD9AE24|nr:SDR family NAD(P)-dependent oxidoreductase [Paenibacillus kobensis]